MTNNNDLLEKADELRKNNNIEESLLCYREYLLTKNALLWFAKFTKSPHESFAAADLALKLQPENEVAQRAIADIMKKLPKNEMQQHDIIKQIISITGMTLLQARSIVWPFKKINKPISDALDLNLIDLKDLLWASKNARNDQVKLAAKTILLSSLLEIESIELPPSLKIIIGSRHSEKKEKNYLLIGGMFLGGILSVSLFSAATLLAGFFGFFTLKINLISVLILGLTIICAMFFSEKYIDQSINYKFGRWGEEKAVEKLLNTLDGRWCLIRNFEWKDRKWGDIDLILIGSGGIWVFEVKAYSGNIRNNGDIWQKKGKFRWYNLSNNPGKQARRNAVRLKDFFF